MPRNGTESERSGPNNCSRAKLFSPPCRIAMFLFLFFPPPGRISPVGRAWGRGGLGGITLHEKRSSHLILPSSPSSFFSHYLQQSRFAQRRFKVSYVCSRSAQKKESIKWRGLQSFWGLSSFPLSPPDAIWRTSWREPQIERTSDKKNPTT